MGSEQRRSVRMKTFLKGRIVFNSGASTMDCLIRDLSGAGARLELSQTSALPEVFDLVVPNKDATYRATLKWRRETGVGVTFDAPGRQPVPQPAVVTEATPVAAAAAEPAAPADPSLSLLLRRISELEAENAALRSVLTNMGHKSAPSAA